jgi:hypothetical protein
MIFSPLPVTLKNNVESDEMPNIARLREDVMLFLHLKEPRIACSPSTKSGLIHFENSFFDIKGSYHDIQNISIVINMLEHV